MTAYELIQRLAKFPPDTPIRHGVDWSDDVQLDDYSDVPDKPALVLTYASSGSPYGVNA